eukprot:CAMPEP_0171198840 /NCGR_PEP_ID=MMETSP0790-20130122/23156_1 /TAXON_ID=2925 /ORGANISM="Alexandrium catenella, Strain OF101" /LENGTH=53 /DNA_ID=CAMNT_0011664169 /DNA_START=60 /DNA_END=217 /DNA_ORIENTATION=+
MRVLPLLLLAVPAASLRTQKQADDPSGKPVNLTAQELEREKYLNNALHAMEAA